MAPTQVLPFLALGVGILGILGISGISGISGAPVPSSLRWIPFDGRIPPHAVSSPDPSGRPQFPCLTPGCELGSFSPHLGSFCSFPWAGRELRSPQFRILTNPRNLGVLDWVGASFGETPEGAVRGCPGRDLFVGRSPEGLGKASKEHQALFVAVDGEEVWYKWYEVLVERQK